MNLKNYNVTTLLISILIVVLNGFTGCLRTGGSGKTSSNFNINSVKTYKDIPGITNEDIAAIEYLKGIYNQFTYGQLLETEAYILPDGTTAGFAIEVCKLLSGLFGIEFVFEFYEWEPLVNGLNNMEIDFTGDLTPTDERLQIYYMTYPIAERTQRIFMLDENYNNFKTENDADGLIFGYLQGSVDAEQIRTHYPDLTIQFLGISNFDTAANMIQTGEIDAFVIEGVLDPAFVRYDFIRSKEFFPLAYSPVSITTANPDLVPFITAMNKYIASGGIDVLFDLYKKGNDEYAAFKLSKSFTSDERAYLDNLISGNKTVKIGMETDNYPVSFYDKAKKEFDGITNDVLLEIEKLTGIDFENASGKNSSWSELFEKLKSGEISLVTELLYSAEREGLFLWADVPYTSSNYALISLKDYPNLLNYQVVRAKVGVLEGTSYADKYKEWFPANDNLVYYKTAGDVFKALEKGKINLIMGSENMLLMQQNFYQNPKFKVNIRFPVPMDSHFGFNLKEEILCSIICKSMDYIDTDRIAQSWTSRGYDYVTRLNRQRMIYAFVIAAITGLLLIRILLFNRSLNKLVIERTNMLEQQTIAAKAASNAKSTFLANMSHEIRTPMNAILGITEILLQDKTISGNTHEALGKIYDSGDVLMGIINDILDLSKIEAGKLELAPFKYDVPSLINDTIQINRMRYEAKPIVFELHLDADTPMNLYGDELRIKQVLNNILSNAFKYTEQGKIRMSVFARPPAKQTAGHAECGNDNDVSLIFIISDTGQGMTEEQIKLLFNEYTRFNLDVNRTIDGAGLGMSITKHLVDLMSGEIKIQSKPGEGSVFTIRLPQKRVDALVCGKETAEKLNNFNFQSTSIAKNSQVFREYMPYGSILIVDDVKTNIYVTRGMLLPYGLKVDSASSGFEAIEKIKAGNHYDIIFMDHMMPKMDGIETTRLIREWEKQQGTGNREQVTGSDVSGQSMNQQDNLTDKNPVPRPPSPVPIIALTANALVGQAEIFLKNGFDGYISKPIDSRELNQVLNDFIRNKKNPSAVNKGKDDDPDIKKFFILDVENAITELEGMMNDSFPENITNDERDSFEIIVHGMKSALANIGKPELSASALRLEKAAREGNPDLLACETPPFIEALRLLKKEITQEINNNSAQPGGDAGNGGGKSVSSVSLTDTDTGHTAGEDASFLMEKLNEIKTACAKYEINAAKAALNELKQKTWPPQTADLIDEINVHLLHSAFKKVITAIESFKYQEE